MSDCPGRFKCHGPASWCDQCGDVDLICDDPKCDAHQRGNERERDYIVAKTKMETMLAELKLVIEEFDRAKSRWDRWCSGNPVMVARGEWITKVSLGWQAMLINEHDAYAAEWLRNLCDADAIPQATIDTRSIKDLKGGDCHETTHFFGGIGGWPLALRLAGWPDNRPIWTGSCPCQPYSNAGNRRGDADERNLWPEMYRLIRECRPNVIVGEQVEGAIRHGWLDGVSADLEREGYAVGAIVLGAHSVNSPHIRQRLFWAAFADSDGREPGRIAAPPYGYGSAVEPNGSVDWMGDGIVPRLAGRKGERRDDDAELATAERNGCDADGIPDAGPPSPRHNAAGEYVATDSWEFASQSRRHSGDYRIIHCLDGKYRRVSAQSGDEPLANGVPRKLGSLVTELERMGLDSATIKRVVRNARGRLAKAGRNRAGRIRGYGNAINVKVAAEFVKVVMEILR